MYMMAWTSLLPDLSPEEANGLMRLAAARYPVSSDYLELRKLCPQIVVGHETPEWVFFGGSFHPWHKGHQACLNLLPEEKTCFVLPDHNPLKEMRQLHLVSTIIELSSQVKFKRHQFLVPTFLLTEKKNPTVEWVERLKQEFPRKKLSLLLGFDGLKNIESWTRYQDLLKLLDCVYVASRLEEDTDRDGVITHLHTLAPQLEIIHLGRHEFEGLSSTEIRKKTKI